MATRLRKKNKNIKKKFARINEFKSYFIILTKEYIKE